MEKNAQCVRTEREGGVTQNVTTVLISCVSLTVTKAGGGSHIPKILRMSFKYDPLGSLDCSGQKQTKTRTRVRRAKLPLLAHEMRVKEPR